MRLLKIFSVVILSTLVSCNRDAIPVTDMGINVSLSIVPPSDTPSTDLVFTLVKGSIDKPYTLSYKIDQDAAITLYHNGAEVPSPVTFTFDIDRQAIFNVNLPRNSGTHHIVWNMKSSDGVTVSGSLDFSDDGGTDLDFENLSRNGRANCYLVTKTGRYLLDARYKGNSSTERVGAVAGAKVLWETNNTESAPVSGSIVKDVEYVNGYVRFTGVADGNALIAVVDAANNILWSWHIWISLGYDAYATGQDYIYQYRNDKMGKDTKYIIGRFMDRNLGALSNIPGDSGVYGLLYEWGRKDPFLGYNASASTTLPEPVASTQTTGTISWAVAHPTTYIYGTADNNRDWLFNEHDDTLWGYEKTIYDPCPPGWKVPDAAVWSLAYGSDNTETHHFDWEYYGMDFGSYFGPDAHIWYPAAGYRGPDEQGRPQNLSRYGFWWASTNSDNNRSYILKIIPDQFSPKTTSPRSFGDSVRCIAK